MNKLTLSLAILGSVALLGQGSVEMSAARRSKGPQKQHTARVEEAKTEKSGWAKSNAFMAVLQSTGENEEILGVHEYSANGTAAKFEGSDKVKANVTSWEKDGIFYGFNTVYSLNYGMTGAIEETILSTLTGYDPETWEEKSKNNFGKRKVFYCTCASYNYDDGKLYGCFYNPAEGEYSFAVVDPTVEKGDKKELGDWLYYIWNASFFDNKGNLYCVDEDGWLFEVDVETGEMIEIEDLGFSPDYDSSAAFDPRSGLAYWSVTDRSGNSCVVAFDPETGESHKMFDLDKGTRVAGLYIPRQEVENGAPGYPTDIDLVMKAGELEGTLTFTMPTEDAEGNTLATEEGSYTLKANDKVVAEGKAVFGAEVKIDVKFEKEGVYRLNLAAGNANGRGLAATDVTFVGADAPQAPANVKAAWDKGEFTLTWDAVTETVNHSDMNPEEVTYKVVRFPEEKVVAENLKETSFKETLYPKEDTEFYYTVIAQYGGKDSEVAASNKVQLKKMYDYDVAVTAISAPQRVEPNADFEIEVTLANLGINPTKDVKVNLYEDGNLVKTENAEDIKYTEETSVKFTRNLGVLDAANHEYYAEVELAGDGATENNVSEKATVLLHLSCAPQVVDLAGDADNGVTLTWKAPAVSGDDVLKETTEDFESYESWTTDELGEWKLVDEDGNEIGDPDIEDMPIDAKRMAYCVIDNTHESIAEDDEFAAHSGNKFLASMWSFDPSDDWLISPELPVGAQVVSFFAKSYVAGSMAESFEVLYSATDAKPKSFKLLKKYEKIPAQWNEYIVSLPEDAKYFAIRCVSTYCNMFFVDDVTYVRKGGEYKLQGYNVYRNGEKINSNVVTETTFKDADAPIGKNSYAVTAVYEEGESCPSLLDLNLTGLESVAEANASVTVEGSRIVIAGAEGLSVSIASADGKLIYAGRGAANMSVAAPQGVMIVKLGTKVYKVLVK